MLLTQRSRIISMSRQLYFLRHRIRLSIDYNPLTHEHAATHPMDPLFLPSPSLIPHWFFHRLTASCVIAIIAIIGMLSLFSTGVVAQSLNANQPIAFTDAEVCQPQHIQVPVELKDTRNDSEEHSLIHIEADHIEAEGEQRVILRGNAELVQGNRGVYAERIVYHRDNERVTAEQDVIFYTANGDEIRADALDMKTNTYIGKGSNVRLRIADNDADNLANPTVRMRATAQRVDFEGDDFQRLHNVTMTSCAEGNQDVLLSAKQIELDHAAGIGSARSLKVTFKNVPIFYFPRASFPINDQRKSGFLFPSVGYDGDSGVIVEVPYYLNLAPHYDATITPRVLSKRGAQLLGEFRYLGENGNGKVRGEILPSDNEYDDQDRYAWRYHHRHQFGDDWRAQVDVQKISDPSYFRDFANEADLIAARYVSQNATLDYFGDDVRFSARAASYDAAYEYDTSDTPPHDVLPQLDLRIKPDQVGAFAIAMDAQYANFYPAGGATAPPNSRHTQRLRIKPSISLPLRRSYGEIIPRVAVQSIGYTRDQSTSGDDARSVAVPIISLDGRLFFEREFQRGAQTYSQTLEPRLLYVSIADKKKQQDEFPVIDSGQGSDTSFAHFFRENRFFGGDRVGDTEHIALGVTSRITDHRSGRQRLALSVGQVFYLEDRTIVLSDSKSSMPETADRSGLFLDVDAALSAKWSMTTFARWSQRNENELAAFRLATDYVRDKHRYARFAYTYADEEEGEDYARINVAFNEQLSARWQLQTSVAYSLERDETEFSALTLAYDGCCWVARVTAQRYLDGEGEHKNRLLFTLELDDLGKIGSRL